MKKHRGESGTPLQGWGQISRLTQCAARGCSAYQALKFATEGAEDTWAYKTGSKIGGGIFDMTSKGKQLKKIREVAQKQNVCCVVDFVHYKENARDNRDIKDAGTGNKFARERGLRSLTVRQMAEVQEV
jgi:hypothetical protein